MPGTTSILGVMLLTSAFVLAHYCRRFRGNIKRRWQALSGGVAVAYVFVNVIPELEAHRPTVAASVIGTVLDAEKRIYLWTLVEFVTFVWLSRLPVHLSSNASRSPRA